MQIGKLKSDTDLNAGYRRIPWRTKNTSVQKKKRLSWWSNNSNVVLWAVKQGSSPS